MIGAGRARERDGEALHALLRYDSPESLCARAVPYVREGLSRGEAVIAVVSAEAAQVLGSALGDDAAGVAWQAEDVSYGRLGVMFEGFRRFLGEQRAAGVPLRLLTQNDALGTEQRMAAHLRFEAMANEVYRPYGYRWACLYDTRAHSAQTMRQVSHSPRSCTCTRASPSAVQARTRTGGVPCWSPLVTAAPTALTTSPA
jgi:hypothetical protein